MKKINRKPPGISKRVNIGKLLFTVFIIVTLMACLTMTVLAEETGEATGGTTIWQKATEIMKDVYDQVLLISTVAAVVTASVALLLMNFSKSGKTVDESRVWLKRIVITWAILNSLGFIMSYITPFFADGKWDG